MNSNKYIGKILIVDDTPYNLKFLANLLLQKGHEVRQALNGQTPAVPPSGGGPGLEFLVRFGCGFVSGFVSGLFAPFLWGFFWKVTTIGWGIITVCVISALICGLICGFLSVKYGDRFWRSLVKFWHLWW